MPSLSISYTPAIGPLVQVAIFLADFAGASTTGVPIKPNFYMALIDTGASCTSITSKVIQDVGLIPQGKQPVGGVHGSKPTNVYHFQLGLAFPTGRISPTGSVNTNLINFLLVGTEFVSSGPFDVLLGRDVLCRGVFSMSFDGHALFSI